MNQVYSWIKILVLISIQWWPQAATAQLVELPNIQLISEKDGLPFNTSTSLVQDGRGFIWVGSVDGLVRYDGYSFVTLQHRPNDSTSLPNNSIISLGIDNEGMIWAGHIGGYVTRIDPQTFKIWYTKIPDSEETSVYRIFCDSKGTIWCTVHGKGLFRFDGQDTFKFICPLSDLPQKAIATPNTYNVIADFYEDGEHNLWLGTNNGLYKFHTDSLKLEHVSSMGDPNVPAFINQLVPDKDGFWCGTYGTGLIHYNIKEKKHEEYLFQKGFKGTNNIIYGAARKSDHEIWLATNGSGIGFFDTISKKFTFFLEDRDLGSGPMCSDLIVDRSGIIWVLSEKGLHKWDVAENHFMFYKLPVTKSDNYNYYGVNAVFKDEQNQRTIIGSSFADGLHIMNKNGKETIIPFPVHANAEPYLIVHEILKDKTTGDILVLTRDYLFRLTIDNRLQKIEELNALLPKETVPYYYRMIQSTNGDLWIASSRTGLYHRDSMSKKWEHLAAATNQSLIDNRLLRLLEGADGKIWLMHSHAGVTVYDPLKKTWTNYRHEANNPESLLSNLLSDITMSRKGEIYIATYEGISKFNPVKNSFINYSLTNGLPTNLIYSLVADEDGILWASTNKGLYMLDLLNNKFHSFSFKDGISGTYSSFILRHTANNEIFVGTFQGFYLFNPEKIKNEKARNAPLLITSIKNLNTSQTEYQLSDKFMVDYQTNSITIEFAALNYFSPQKNRYRYRMVGLDKDWIETSDHSVNYSGIPSGSYHFHVMLIGNQQSQGEIQVIVSTPFWKQDWFRMLLFTVALGSIYFVYRIRLNQVRKEEKLKREYNKKLADVEMKALKAQMNPHFIFNSLNSINRYIIKSEPEKASLYLTKFSKLIRLILDNSNSKIISLENELNALKLYIELEALRFNEKFTYEIRIKKELNPISVGVPPMIIQPFVENAIWHGLLHKEESGRLEIEIERYGSGLKCIITDNGVGRKKAGELKSKSINNAKSYGMKITSDRLTMLNGESKISTVEIIDLEDNEGNALGTKVIVKILSAEIEPEF